MPKPFHHPETSGIAPEADDAGATEQSEADQAGVDQPVAVDYEKSPEVRAMLQNSPFALPLPVQTLKEHRVAVSQIPLGMLLNSYVGDLNVRINDSTPKSRDSAQWDAASKPPLYEGSQPASARQAELQEKMANAWTKSEGPSLIHTPLESTNKGKNPNSRWYIRGVLHTHPLSLYIAAMATFLIVWLVPASVIAAVLLILSSEMPDQFSWVSPQFLWVPAALLVVGLVYLIFGISGCCRICNQKLFIYRSRIKNGQAHHLPGLGYVLPLCIHLMVFRWFRCAHCGTPIRLKK